MIDRKTDEQVVANQLIRAGSLGTWPRLPAT